MEGKPTLEYFGATTFRLRASGLTIFHDTWLDRPALMPEYLNINTVTDADYIVISHAHFDHLPGADRIARQTGAIIIANCEAINRLRDAGVPETQLLPVSGGERIPLFTKDVLNAAKTGEVPLRQGPPGAPPEPHHSFAAAQIHVWPSLHCLLPGSHDTLPDVFDSGTVYTGSSTPFEGTVDVTRGMKYGLFRLKELIPTDAMDEKTSSFVNWMEDKKANVMSACDGGQLLFHVILGGGDGGEPRSIVFNAHLGAYEGIVKRIEPKPDIAVLGIAGRANLDGRPFDGSGAEFATELVKWMGEPGEVIWCLHDECLIKPYRVDTTAATAAVEKETRSRIVELRPSRPYVMFSGESAK
ncbi:hypothetical protein P170DRAFT_442180 [Aspergillus steynii IBT 23096]|uniref:Metallo-beta-lactamase domain-containing protein n=1 Tax=Aspergillus steynii IBT 23096 TaxID=1392250 RepID=A0A2I2GM96_9EURO|nr:uncharacterized protein P170DRAFT_442180 [Aspergillus steynii IBT 23096]PLB53996.1 hypothetical protein P170DRAFT_442180 [Aspergillus steynii IBT 23096]